MEIPKLKKIIETTLNENKADNIVSINLKGKSYIADYMIIASGTSSRHIQSLSEILLSTLEKKGMGRFKIEGGTSDGWKLIDTLDIIIHIFHPEKRKFYDLEKMWSEPLLNERINIWQKYYVSYCILLFLACPLMLNLLQMFTRK